MDYKVEILKDETFEMNCLIFGSGKRNLVILPGMALRPISSSPEGVIDAYKMFTNDYTVYVFDRKKNMQEGYYVEDMANDTIKAIDMLNIRNLYIMAASQGGMIGQYIAIKRPELINKMVLVSTSYYSNEISDEFFNKCGELAKEKNARSLASYLVRTIYSKQFVNSYKDEIVNMYADLNDDEFKQFYICAKANSKMYVLNELSNLKVDTMVVVSKEDKVFGYESSLLMAYKMNCECVLYDDYSHALYDEADDFKERLMRYFK